MAERIKKREPFSAGKQIFVPPVVGPKGANFFIKNLPLETTIEHLKFIFGRYGKLLKVHIPLDKFTRRPKGIAEVNYENKESAEKMLNEIGYGIPLTKYKMYVTLIPRAPIMDDRGVQEPGMDNGLEVHNIPKNLSNKDVKRLFKVFGNVLFMDRQEGSSTARIQMETFDMTRKALFAYKMPLITIEHNMNLA